MREKNSRKEGVMDDLIGERMEEVGEMTEGAVKSSVTEKDPKMPQRTQSYKDSLLGFKGEGYNGAMLGSSCMEEEILISDLTNQCWKLPEPSNEIKKLMELYPVVPYTEEEFNECCQPWNNSLIITVLGARFPLVRLKEHLGRIWGFNDFQLIDIPNNYFIVSFNDDGS